MLYYINSSLRSSVVQQQQGEGVADLEDMGKIMSMQEKEKNEEKVSVCEEQGEELRRRVYRTTTCMADTSVEYNASYPSLVGCVLDKDVHGRDITLLQYSNSSLRSSARLSLLGSLLLTSLVAGWRWGFTSGTSRG